MKEILLTNENFVKEVQPISDNLAGKYMRPSIREAQDIGLRGIVGDTMLARLKDLVDSGEISREENERYRLLLERSQYYLAYLSVVGIAEKVSFKIANAGVVKTPDEKVSVADQPDMAKVQASYQAKADHEALLLQNFLLEHYSEYPELREGDYHRIRSNLYSAASCGVFLGGARGKLLPGIPVGYTHKDRR